MTDITELAQLRAELSNPAIGSKDHLRKLALSLVEALELKEEQRANWFQMAQKLGEDLDAAEKRIAELESRTVTVKQYDEFQICHYGATEDYAKGYIDCQNNFFKWLTAAGIKWEAE
ncbi:ead/Ea22-like family protein [Klebsiella grimontii]|uniref:ead/Ea22-like family protein n=1 Tax=Klebsiella grimontii TaxID=2058152 RepID=UPI001CCD4317|nr:ead/Ea22-like family protein [Klebsiella grimontii]MBZ7513593.1 ead/Ea22-like family protein [Klebsiella grimontii]